MFNKKKINQPLKDKIAKVPVIMQMEALECGAASLAMVMAYYGRWVPLEQLRKECGVSRDGSNMKSMSRVAKMYNLQPKAFRMKVENLQEKGTFPAIIFWQYNHFIVLDGFLTKGGKKYVALNDPARGKVTMPIDEFERSYSGICMMFEPSPEFEPGGEPASILEFARQRLTGTFPMFMMVMLTTLIAALTGILLPVFSRFFVDRLLTRTGLQWSTGFFVLLGLVIFSQAAGLFIKTVYMLKLQGKMAAIANTTFLWHILRLPVEFFEQRMSGDIAQRLQSNQEIANVLINTFAPVVLDFAAMIFNLVIMINYSPLLAFVGILSVAANLYLAHVISEQRVNITRVQMRDMAQLRGTTLQGINMIETIKSAGAENGFFANWAGYQANANAQQVKFSKLNQTLGQLPQLLTLFTSNLILFLGVMLVMQGDWTIGLISAFNGYLLAFQTPAQSLILAGQKIQEMRTNMERVQDVFKYPVDIDYTGQDIPEGDDLYKLDGLVEVKNVTFGYNKLAEPIVKDFSMTVEPGKSVAIVGPSGCGKSTISKLITGLYPVWSGEILFDGKPQKEINRNIFTSSVACINQDITLFEDNVTENIRMWDKSIENFEVILAARDAIIHDEIIQREGDYSALVAEGGKNFSGGQRQRLEIAGALAQEPTIIIMDEATSALDTKTEYDLMKSVKRRGVSLIIISHRLSIIRDCDEIIVMKEGEILDRGTHSELMGRCEYYSALITNE
ncbi:MAG: NHLP family bacteriocin export ABC transporter peptidase/permease/ATPase subunit [Synergistaceae bacterium]|nr:NHLP family bacteriocin export ABC transporter peptidase/permease/ATPase subunit [Synergistaceae bacterium]